MKKIFSGKIRYRNLLCGAALCLVLGVLSACGAKQETNGQDNSVSTMAEQREGSGGESKANAATAEETVGERPSAGTEEAAQLTEKENQPVPQSEDANGETEIAVEYDPVMDADNLKAFDTLEAFEANERGRENGMTFYYLPKVPEEQYRLVHISKRKDVYFSTAYQVLGEISVPDTATSYAREMLQTLSCTQYLYFRPDGTIGTLRSGCQEIRYDGKTVYYREDWEQRGDSSVFLGYFFVFAVDQTPICIHVPPVGSLEEALVFTAVEKHIIEKSAEAKTSESTAVSAENSLAYPPVFADGEYETVSDEQYTYYLNGDGTPVYITAKDFLTMNITVPKSDSFGEAEAAKKAEELFDQVFPEAVKKAGREKETLVTDGQVWLVTVRLLEDGYDTGYTASIHFTLEGKLIISSFSPGEEDRPQILITAEQAILLAQEALLQDCRERYGESVVLHFEQAKDVACHYRVWAAKGQHYWEIESLVPTENMGPWENYELYSAIRIDSQTGECLMIATPLK